MISDLSLCPFQTFTNRKWTVWCGMGNSKLGVQLGILLKAKIIFDQNCIKCSKTRSFKQLQKVLPSLCWVLFNKMWNNLWLRAGYEYVDHQWEGFQFCQWCWTHRHVVCRLVSNRPLKCINGLINIWLLATKVVSGSDYLRVFEDWCTLHKYGLGLGHQNRIRLA